MEGFRGRTGGPQGSLLDPPLDPLCRMLVAAGNTAALVGVGQNIDIAIYIVALLRGI